MKKQRFYKKVKKVETLSLLSLNALLADEVDDYSFKLFVEEDFKSISDVHNNNNFDNFPFYKNISRVFDFQHDK